MADTPVSNNNSSPVTQTQNTAQVDTYKNALGGTEQVAQEIVDAARAAEPQAPQEVAGQGGTFHGYDILDNPADLNSVETSAGMPMRPATNAVAGALSTGNAIDPAVISHTINKPAAGQTVAVVVQPGEVLATKFDPNAADLSLQGKNLVMSFDDGSKVILEQFAADTQNLPTIALQNGSLIAGGIIVAQLQGLDNNIFALETAAGASGEGGTFIYSDDMGNVIDLLNKLPPIGFTSMVFAQPRPEVFYADEIDRTGATFVPGFQTVSALFGTVSGGFEDWKPGANTGNMTVEPMALQIAFTPDDNEVVDAITIDGIPAGAQIFYGTTGNYSPVTVVNGSVTFTGAQLASGTIFLLPPTNSDSDIPLNLSLLVRDPDTNATLILTQNVVATVDAVADMPILTSNISIGGETSNGAISAAEGNPVSINVNVSFPDNDGSETHTIILSGVPAQWIPAGGTLISTSGVVFTATTAADGTITYTAKVSGNVSGTIVFNPNDWVSENGAAKLVFTARTEETVTDNEITLANNVAEIKTPFTVDIIEDVPQLISVTTPSKIYEHDLTVPGTDSVGGNIVVDFKSDGPGTIKLSTEGLAQLNLTSNGQPLTYALSADGKTITATNPAGETVFTVGLGNAANDGSKQNVPYTFTLIKQIDHPTGNGNNVTDIPIKMVATDDDGDSIKGTFVVSVVDDVPTAQPAQSMHDETNAINVPLTGKVTVDFGADGAGKVEGNNVFSSGGSQSNNALSSNGVPINVTFENGQYIGKAGGVTIFTMTINADGSYSFVQKGPLDHADGSNPNDVIDLKFGYKVTDYDGDTVTNTITVKVIDDAPVAHDDTATIPDGQTVATGNVLDNDTLSHDTPNLLTNASVNGVTKYFTSPDGTDAGGKYVLLEGEYGTLKIYQDGKYTYTYDAENHGPTVDRFDLPDNAIPFPILTENSDIDDKMTPEETQIAIDTANALQIDFPTKLTVEIMKSSGFVSIYANSLGAFTLNNDGSINNVDLLFGNATGNNSNPLSGNDLKAEYNMTSSSGRVVFFMIQNGLESLKALGLADADGRATDPAGSLSMEKQADGSLKLVYTNGAGEKQYVDATIFTSEKDFNSDGLAHTIAGQAPGTTNDALFGFEDLVGTGDRDFNDIIFKVDVAERYTPGGDMKDHFNYTVVDKDGDPSSANLNINITDNGPGVAPNINASVDESNLNTPIGGTIVVENASNYVLVPGNSSGGSKLNDNLTSNGVPIKVTIENGQYVGKAGDKTVFTLTLEPGGKYTFVQTGVLDHADGKNPDDVIKLTFNYEARDADGDATKGTITVNVADDAPLAVVDSNFIPNGSVLATGNILTNDRMSNDSPTLVQSAKVNGTEKSFTNPDGTDAGGKFIVLTGTYGQLKLYQDGKYTYTYDTANHQGNLVEKFDYTIVDFDGDTSSTGNNSGLVITIVDNGPGTAPNIVASVDETTLNASVGGTIVAENASNYVLVAGNSSEGSKLNGALTSGGVPVTITLQNGQYVGKAGDKTVFTLTLEANGKYTFVQTAVLDHANGSDPNDVIKLNFSYEARDADGDAAKGTITVNVADDAPLAVVDSNFIPNGSVTATGDILANDRLSNDSPTLVQSAKVNNTSKSFGTPDGTDAGGKFVLLNGTYGQLKLYENGKYTYTYDAANHEGNLTEKFDYTIVDRDGDTSSTGNNSGLVITIVDNGPGTAPNIVASVDETTLNASVGGTIVAENASNYVLVAGNSSEGSKLNGALTSGGVPVTITLQNGQYVGKAGDKTVFTLTLEANGKYIFVQTAVLDHANGADPNDVIKLNFSYEARDADGDAAKGTITVNVADDAPLAVVDSNFIPNGSVTATGDILANDRLSNDSPTLVQSAKVNGTIKSFGTPDGTDAGGKFVLLNGTYGQLKLYENGKYTYTYDTANHQGNLTEKFDYTIVDRDGDTSSTSNNSGLVITIVDNGPGSAPNIVASVDETTLNASVGGTIVAEGASSYVLIAGNSSEGSKLNGSLTSGGVPVTVTLQNGQYVGKAGDKTVFTLTLEANGKYTFVQTAVLDHANGADPNDVIKLNFTYEARDADGDAAKGTITVNVADDAPLAVADTANIPNGSNTASGNILDNDRMSNDSPTLVQSAKINNTTKSFGTPDGTDAGGKFVLLNGTYGQLKLYENGKYTYTYDTANHTGNLTEKFDYTIVDRDGDTSSTSNNSGLVINIKDGAPVVQPSEVTIDETNQLGSYINGKITVDFGSDGAGSFAANQQSFASSGSQLNGQLTSGGLPVTVTYQFNGWGVGQFIGSITVGKETQNVFAMTISPDGSYIFIQNKPLDHADGKNPNDVIDLKFGYTVSDADGDKATGTVTVKVLDDAPVAVNDTNFVPNGSVTATGDILANDLLSKDSPTLVQSAKVNDATKSFATPDGTDAGGKFVLLTGTYGQLKLYENGKYTYTYDTAKHTGNFVEKFDYTIVDRDGDTSSTGNNSGLVITITDNGPGTAPNVVTSVDETTLNVSAGGTIVAEGASSYVLVSGNSSEGSKLNGALTSGGVPVTITLQNGQYVGKAGNTTVFTLTLESNGKYTFVQKAVLDHANGSDPNDVIKLNFSYEARDADGDASKGTITVNVADDAPLAVNDTNFIPNNSTTASGNILDNDRMSNDSPTLVQSAKVNGTTKSFGTPDGTDAGGKFVLLTGTYGQLKLYENGKYTYTYDAAKHEGTLTEKFDYTIVDRDGDTSSTGNNSGLVITIVDKGPFNTPDIIAQVDETTDMHKIMGGTIVTPNATSYALVDNTHSSGGSLMNGKLTSHGEPVYVSFVNGKYIGQVGDLTVFSLTLDANGNYKFAQDEPLDHADGSNPNDIIELKFDYIAKDADGDSAVGHITVKVLDDAPIAVNDTALIPDGQVQTSGNVLLNDDLSNDTPNLLTDVTVGGVTRSFSDASGTDAGGKFLLMEGEFGQIKIYENGNYNYTYDTANHGPDFDRFDLPDNALVFPHVTEQNNIDLNLTPEQTQILVDTANAMQIDFQTKVHIELQESVAGAKNGLGAFTLNANGSISNVDLLFGNATLNNENRLNGDDLKATYDMTTNNGKVVFFIVAGGFDRLAEMGLSDSIGRATEPTGSLSMEQQADGSLKLFYTDSAGNKHMVDATIYTSEQDYNNDGSAHTIAGIAPGTSNTAMFGFEDLPNGASDRDFNDVVFKVDVEDHFNPGTDMKEHIEYTVKDKDGDSSHANLDIDIIDKGTAPAPLMAQNNNAGRFASTDATAFSLAALTMAMVSHDDILLNSFDLNDTGSSFIKEAIVEVRDTQSGDDVFFNFDNSAYSLIGSNVHKDGVDTGLDATINKTAVGNFEVHIIGEASTTEYGALLKTIHFNGSENAASDNRFVDVTITDEQSHTSSIATVHSDDAVASTETYQNIAAVDAGHEVLTGTEGADSFVLAQGGHEADTIVDYHSEQGDRLDLSDLLSGSTYTPGLSVVDDYVKIDSATGNVYVDATGHGTFDNSNHVATIDNISAVDVVNVLLNDQEGNKVIHTV